jgi:hypothetical protein
MVAKYKMISGIFLFILFLPSFVGDLLFFLPVFGKGVVVVQVTTQMLLLSRHSWGSATLVVMKCPSLDLEYTLGVS